MYRTIGVPEDKRVKCLNLVQSLIAAHNRRSIMVKEVQKMVGSLNFICQALPAGRPFLCNLYRLTKTAAGIKCKPGHRRRISAETVRDLEVFVHFLSKSCPATENTFPFLNRLKITSKEIQLFTDASGNPNLGCGLFFRGEWRQGM